MDRRKYLKVPELMIQKARVAGHLPSILFYYKAKAIQDNGFFKRGEMITRMMKEYGISRSTCERHISILLSKDLLHISSSGYSLSSYDKLWIHLGYDLSQNSHRKGTFKINKVKIAHVMDLEYIALSFDIESNLQDQRKAVELKTNRFSSKHCKPTQHKPTATPGGVMVADVENGKLGSTIKYWMEEDEGFSPRVQSGVNKDITLSCYGIGKLAGYSERSRKSAGHKMERILSAMGLIQVTQRQEVIGTFHGTQKEFLDYKREKIGIGEWRSPECYKYLPHDSLIIYTLPNLIETNY